MLQIPPNFDPKQRYLLGISGGRDSVALLELLLDAGFRNLVLCHLNHQLRGEDSEADSRFVQDLAQNLGLAAKVANREVLSLARQAGSGVEAAARRARLEFFAECAREFGTSVIFLAHHADDQAETTLINLIRGAGSTGLAAMEPVSTIGVGNLDLTLIRPLLNLERVEIPAPASFREDASNASDAFLRNRIRHRLIPEIERVTGRPLKPGLRRTAEILREEDRFLEALMAEKFDACQDRLPVPALRELPVALQRRAIRAWLMHLSVAEVGFAEIEAVRGLVEPGASAAKVNLPAGLHVRRREKVLFLEGPR